MKALRLNDRVVRCVLALIMGVVMIHFAAFGGVRQTALARDEMSSPSSMEPAQISVVLDPPGVQAPSGYRVGINGTGCAYDTIQDAVDAAVSGGSIQVSAGVYNELVTISSENLTIAGDYDGTCASLGGGLTTIDGVSLTGTTLVSISNSLTTLRDLNIINGSGATWGGGIVLSSSSEVNLDNVSLVGNTATYGGGAFLYYGTVMTVTNSWIADNTASQFGGGFRIRGNLRLEGDTQVQSNQASDGGGIALSGGSLTLDDSKVRYNQTTGGDGRGGGIYATMDSHIIVQNNSSVSDNAAYNGGGVYAHDSTVNVTVGFFYDNQADDKGGGLYLTDDAVLDGEGVRVGGEGAVLGNDADFGAGIYAITSTITLDGSQIFANLAETSGAGVYADNSIVNLNTVVIGNLVDNHHNILGADGHTGVGMFLTGVSTATLSNTVVAGNTFSTTGSTYGGGIYVEDQSILLLEHNSRVEYNTAPSGVTGGGAGVYADNATVTVDNSQVISNTSGSSGGGFGLNNGSMLNLQNFAVVSYNHADGAEGGGIASTGPNDINIEYSYLERNWAGTDGGGIYLDGGTLDATGWWLIRWNFAFGNGGGVAVTGSGDADFAVTSWDYTNPSGVGANVAAGGDGGGLYLTNDDTVRMEATGGHWFAFNTNSATGSGGGAAVINAGTLEFVGHVQMNSNHADVNGGAVFLDNASGLDMVASGTDRPEIETNWADNGGGVYAMGGSSVACADGLFGLSLGGNEARVGSGGAIYLDSSTLKTVNCIFLNNQAALNGGAIFSLSSEVQIASDFDTCDPLLGSCSLFKGNLADSDMDESGNGGAIFNTSASLYTSHTVFNGNSAYLGGAIYQTTNDSKSRVENSLFYRNSSEGSYGSAILVSLGDFSVEHITLANNTGAPAFTADSAETMEVENSIAWNNTDGFSGSSSFSSICNIDQAGFVGTSTDPFFIDPGAGDDYHLGWNSPAIDACASGLPVDLDAVSRPMNGLYDMGAYEYLKYIFLPLIMR